MTVSAPVIALPRWVWLAARLPALSAGSSCAGCLPVIPLRSAMAGTINLTSVGMVATGGGWGIAIAEMSLNVVVGGIEQKARVIDGQICVRECLADAQLRPRRDR